jgi:hypothetical protein
VPGKAVNPEECDANTLKKEKDDDNQKKKA